MLHRKLWIEVGNPIYSDLAWSANVLITALSSVFEAWKMKDRAPKDLIKRIIQALVDNPEQVEVSEVEGENVLVLELRVAKEDIGKVIGKQGRTAQAIRSILSAASGKVKKRTVFEILEWSCEEKGPKIQDLQTQSSMILNW